MQTRSSERGKADLRVSRAGSFAVGYGAARRVHPISRMKTFVTRSSFAGALLVLLAAAGCAGSGAGAAAPETAPRPAGASAAELEAIYRARVDSARTRYTEADVRFMTGMIVHHAQALVMSALAPTNGASPAIQLMAERIINAQEDEIASMQQWLRLRGEPVPEVHMMGGELMVHGADHSMHMTGMLTPEQLERLRRARGEEFDRLFLMYMIQHHRGAVTMVNELFSTDGAGQDEEVFKFASDVQADQGSEIARMESMLEALSSRRPGS